MREQNGRDFGEVVRLVLLQPKQLRDRVAGQHGVAREMNAAGLAAELVRDLLALRCGGSIAPELGWTDHFVVGIENDKAVLLAAHADAGDL